MLLTQLTIGTPDGKSLTPKAKGNTSDIDQIITINSKARCISSIDTNDN